MQVGVVCDVSSGAAGGRRIWYPVLNIDFAHVQEEREVLASIYESDECFKQSSPTSFSYRVH